MFDPEIIFNAAMNNFSSFAEFENELKNFETFLTKFQTDLKKDLQKLNELFKAENFPQIKIGLEEIDNKGIWEKMTLSFLGNEMYFLISRSKYIYPRFKVGGFLEITIVSHDTNFLLFEEKRELIFKAAGGVYKLFSLHDEEYNIENDIRIFVCNC